MPPQKKKVKKIEENDRSYKKELPDGKLWLNLLRWAAVFATVFVIGLMVTVWGIYQKNWQNYFIEAFEKSIPFPAASIGYGGWISIAEFNSKTKAIKVFLEGREVVFQRGIFDFSTPEGLRRLEVIKKNVLNQAIENKIMEIEAEKRGIQADRSEIKDISRKILERDNKREENLNQLKLMYNWGENDFSEQIVKKMVIKGKLEEKLKSSGELNAAARKKVNIVREKVERGENFENVAREYSEASSRQYGGLLPPFSQNESPEEFKNTAFLLGEGEVSEPIETENGWQIIKLERSYPEGGVKKVEIRHILINKNSFDSWVAERKKAEKVKVFLKPYYWHSQMGRLYFKDEELNGFEDQINREYLEERSQEIDFIINTE
ncbi:MAG: hypothetical protein FJZ04_00495 [Candidatus Moranbacteria bacterium]|nr:hypothetical protein [Candidatus Moranbacteria bacterium]